MTAFTVIKRDAFGNDLLSYLGALVERNATFVCIDAAFDLSDRELGYIRLRRGDHFREWFYTDRWFNIFRILDAESHALKGWYCNITQPPTITAGQVAAEDLGLDVFVQADGQMLLLDEDDFLQLNLSSEEVKQAWAAVDEIKDMVANRLRPFDEIRIKKSQPSLAPQQFRVLSITPDRDE